MRIFRFALVITFVMLAALTLAAQEKPKAVEPSAPAANVSSSSAPAAQTAAQESKPAEGEGEENAELKYNTFVKWVARKAGLSQEASYWLFVILNFLILAGGLYAVMGSKIAKSFGERSVAIKKGIEEARQASAEATAKLREIEERLAKLDSEVASIRAAAEADFSAEEKRIAQAAEEDARRVIESAQQEIEAAARSAQHELKSYAAELAVDLAAKSVDVDPATDAALVKGFVGQLGKDGK